MGWIVVGIIAAILVYLVALYNRLITFRNRVDNAWAQVEVQLKRRYDLIPNLVETVKGYAAHEKEVFETVVRARQAAIAAQGPQEKGPAENTLTQALRQLFAVAEAYPVLRASENFQSLQGELAETENKIAYARQFYNDTVYRYNTAIEKFPALLFARAFGFAKRAYFEAEEEAQRRVEVRFS